MAHSANKTQNVPMEMDHSYDRENPKERRRDASHITPTKTIQKKVKPDNGEISNAALLQAINSLTARFDSQDRKLEDIADKIRQNSIMIVNISKSVEFNAAEIKEYKQKYVVLEKKTAVLEQSNEELRLKTSELERYKRRWNLRIKGMKEHVDEDARKEVTELLGSIAPHLTQKLEDVVDSVHRVGKKESVRHRQMIVQFTMRKFRDEIWKITKNSQLCTERGIRFAEDLSAEDRVLVQLFGRSSRKPEAPERRLTIVVLWDTSTAV